jgi:hypothetical protein
MKKKKYKIKIVKTKKIRGVWAIQPITRIKPNIKQLRLTRLEEREKREEL